MKTEDKEAIAIATTRAESRLMRLRNKLIDCGVICPDHRLSITNMVADMLLDEWNTGFEAAARIHREVYAKYNK